MRAAIAFESVSKWFDPDPGRGERVRALDEVSFDWGAGEFTLIVGPSGSGKTTLLRLLAGLEEPSCGGVRIGGRSMAGVAPKHRAVALMAQESSLFPHLTVGENLALGLRLRKILRGDAVSRIAAVSMQLGLGPLRDRYPAQLSGGERQRVALARALLRNPAVLLLDEPFNHLDGASRANLMAAVARVHRGTGASVVCVTHDPAEATPLADRVVVLRQGRLEQQASPMEVYRQPANRFVATQLGWPPINLFRGALQRRQSAVVFEDSLPGSAVTAENWSLPLDVDPEACELSLGRIVDLGVRPEAIHVHPDSGGVEDGFWAVVDSAEFAGARVVLRLRVGQTQFLATADDSVDWRRRDRAFCRIDAGAAHFFDAATGQRLNVTDGAAGAGHG